MQERRRQKMSRKIEAEKENEKHFYAQKNFDNQEGRCCGAPLLLQQ